MRKVKPEDMQTMAMKKATLIGGLEHVSVCRMVNGSRGPHGRLLCSPLGLSRKMLQAILVPNRDRIILLFDFPKGSQHETR